MTMSTFDIVPTLRPDTERFWFGGRSGSASSWKRVVHREVRSTARCRARPGRSTIAPEDARPALAKRLVALSKDGVLDEEYLAVGGLIHLRLLAIRATEIARGY
jgi:hypothetical protein